MKLKKNELKVFYHGEPNPELDKAIEKCVKAFGYTRWASGISMASNRVRDLAFDKTKTIL